MGVVKVGGSLRLGCDRVLAEEGPGVLAAMLVVVEVVVWVLRASQFDSDSVQEVYCISCQQFALNTFNMFRISDFILNVYMQDIIPNKAHQLFSHSSY